MNHATAWENRQRVPITRHPVDDDDDDEPRRPERSALTLVRALVGVLLADPNPALGRQCLALVTGIGYDGSSMSEIAKQHGVTRASISKRCVELCETLGIPPTRAMRPVGNRQRCRAARFRETAAS